MALSELDVIGPADISGNVVIGGSLTVGGVAVVTTGALAVTAGKTLTVTNSLTLSGTDGKALTLTGSLTVGADTSITGGGTIALGGFTGTLPATGTLALRDVSNTFTATTFVRTSGTTPLTVTSTAASNASSGGGLILANDDGAAQASGDRLGGLFFAGHDGVAASQIAAAITAFTYSGAVWAASDHPTELRFETAPDGSGTRANRLTISETGLTLPASHRLVTPLLRVTAPSVPASAAAAGTTGEIAWDASFIYICTASSTWKRVAIATW